MSIVSHILEPADAAESQLVSEPSHEPGFLYEPAKRMLDLAVSLLSLAILSPLLAILAIIVRRDSAGPVIYRRRVVGRGGHQFDAFKFRSMVINGDELLAQNPDLLEQWRKDIKLEDDPRVTRSGAWMRKYSLDELPQLVNVLRGEMSMVGPRMISPPELERFGSFATELITVKPGITGLWQISGRSELSYDQRIYFNKKYVRSRSFKLDVAILLHTVPVVLRGGGAY